MPQIVLHLILLSNHKKSKKERRITEIFLQRIPFSLKNYFCLGGVWLSLLGTNAQVLLSARSPSLILRCAPVWRALAMGQTSESLNLNGRCAFLSAALPSPSSLRDATSPKVRGLGSPPSFRFRIFMPCCRKGSRQALRSDFTPLPRAPPLGELARSA